MKYLYEPELVDAFQMTKERRTDNSEWPEWLNAAWNAGIENEAVRRYNSDSPMPDLLAISSGRGVIVINWGDWICRSAIGLLFVVGPETFTDKYVCAVSTLESGDGVDVLSFPFFGEPKQLYVKAEDYLAALNSQTAGEREQR